MSVMDSVSVKKYPIALVVSDSVYSTKLYYPAVENDQLIIRYIPDDTHLVKAIFLRTVAYLNLTTLDISGQPISRIPDIYTIRTLICDNCQLVELPSYMPNLRHLSCVNNLLTSIPNYPLLNYLNCAKNVIERLPSVSGLSSIKHLICSDNPITSIYYPTLSKLEAYGCPLLIIHYIPSTYRRSSTLQDGHFKWKILSDSYLSTEYAVIDWRSDLMSNSVESELLISLRRFLFK